MPPLNFQLLNPLPHPVEGLLQTEAGLLQSKQQIYKENCEAQKSFKHLKIRDVARASACGIWYLQA
jgi:hypothetical protein